MDPRLISATWSAHPFFLARKIPQKDPSTPRGQDCPSTSFRPIRTQAGTSGYLVAEGYSNYNALQVDFRQRSWHGLQFDANYTWSHTLGISTPNNWQGQSNIFTLRDMRLGYGPSLFDIRHAVNINGSYDLPFGRGKQFANHGGALDRIVGGWTIGSIFVFQTGVPFLLQGGNSTFNANPINDGFGDGGIVLNGVSPSQLQSAVGVYRVPGQPFVDFINPKYLASPSAAEQTPHTLQRIPPRERLASWFTCMGHTLSTMIWPLRRASLSPRK